MIFNDESIEEIVNKIEISDSIKKEKLNKISSDIKRLEEFFKKWNLEETSIYQDGFGELYWSPTDNRLSLSIAKGSIKPLIEMPSGFRVKAFECGYLKDFLNHILSGLT